MRYAGVLAIDWDGFGQEHVSAWPLCRKVGDGGGRGPTLWAAKGRLGKGGSFKSLQQKSLVNKGGALDRESRIWSWPCT